MEKFLTDSLLKKVYHQMVNLGEMDAHDQIQIYCGYMHTENSRLLMHI